MLLLMVVRTHSMTEDRPSENFTIQKLFFTQNNMVNFMSTYSELFVLLVNTFLYVLFH